MGLGVVLQSPCGAQQSWSVRAEGRGCNNEAELRAILLALQMAIEAGAPRLHLFTDSRIAADHLGVGHKPPSIPAGLQALVGDIQRAAHGRIALSVEWSPRHRNHQADSLSRAAVGLPEKPAASARAQRKRR